MPKRIVIERNATKPNWKPYRTIQKTNLKELLKNYQEEKAIMKEAIAFFKDKTVPTNSTSLKWIGEIFNCLIIQNETPIGKKTTPTDESPYLISYLKNANIIELQSFITSEIEFSLDEKLDVGRKLVLLQLFADGYTVTDQNSELIEESSRISILETCLDNNKVVIAYGTVTKIHNIESEPVKYFFTIDRVLDTIFDEKLKNTEFLQSHQVALYQDPIDDSTDPFQTMVPNSNRGVIIPINTTSAPNWNRNSNRVSPTENNAVENPQMTMEAPNEATPQASSSTSSTLSPICPKCQELSKKMITLTTFSDILSKMINLAGEIQFALEQNPDMWRFLPFSATCKGTKYSLSSELIEKAYRKHGWEIKSHTRYLVHKYWQKKFRQLTASEKRFMSQYTVERLNGSKETIKKYCHEDRSNEEPEQVSKKRKER